VGEKRQVRRQRLRSIRPAPAQSQGRALVSCTGAAVVHLTGAEGIAPSPRGKEKPDGLLFSEMGRPRAGCPLRPQAVVHGPQVPLQEWMQLGAPLTPPPGTPARFKICRVSTVSLSFRAGFFISGSPFEQVCDTALPSAQPRRTLSIVHSAGGW